MSQAYEPVVPLDNIPGLGPQQVTSPDNLRPLPLPPPLVDEQKDVQDNYEAVGDFGDAQYVPGDLSQPKRVTKKAKKTKSELSSDTSENSEGGKKRTSKRRRGKQMKIPLWAYAIATILMFTAATACTISFVTGIVEHWFLK